MRRRPVRALIAALFLSVLGNLAAAERVSFVGSYTWPREDHGFGGFSGLEVSEDGSGFTAISDQGRIVTGQFLRENGRIKGVTAPQPTELRNLKGQELRIRQRDAEGLALADGRIYISFEGAHRIWVFDTPEKAQRIPGAKAFRTLQGNSGLEALAMDPKGRLITLPERSGRLTRPFPVWRYDGTWRKVYDLPRSDGFLPVGADFGPEGRLYLLERAFNGWGFKTRVRRFTLSETAVLREETLVHSHYLRHDNLEGLSVWRTPRGDIRLTMISDDNFSALQRTQFVEYSVPETLASEADTR